MQGSESGSTGPGYYSPSAFKAVEELSELMRIENVLDGSGRHARQPCSQGLFPGLGKDPGNEVACEALKIV